ncbi:alpha/beta fold hydrolase [Thalassotalea agarivorans]|uniref:Uncharacterized protein n=1 Tax=Thalassotalea agarivorans TaxID=349064 RepID=A0A1H9ZUB6_THASX|nr:alpha/beta fold hydrolase [Thalassotalea agarivorans]SES85325.1 hypothetical protein SAMN05660429_00591 [Thalassotalea agarivorans]
MKASIPAVIYSIGMLISGATANANELATKIQVQDTIINMVNAIDSKSWTTAESYFSDSVFVDYSSMSGQAGSNVAAKDLVSGWQSLLEHVSTLHQLSNFDVRVNGETAEVYSHVYATHIAENIEYWDIFGRYHHKLTKVKSGWKITDMTLIVHGQKGNKAFLKEASEMKNVSMRKVTFKASGETVVGNVYLPSNFDEQQQYPAVIVSGSWTTVKEQMSGLYAEKLAEQGFVALAFDFRNFGESDGAMRFHENPAQKVEDIHFAIDYLQTLPYVSKDKIGALGICAGAMYTLQAAATDTRIKSVVTTASWLHDSEAVKLFYGGEDGVAQKIAAAKQAKQLYRDTGAMEYIPSISTTDESAAMFGEYDYYLNPKRGAVPQWSADKFAVASWEDWLTLDPMPSAKQLHTPTLMIHSDGAVLPEYTKTYFDNIATSNKQLFWMETSLESPFHQFNFYDQQEEVDTAITQATLWFNKQL